MCGITSVLPYRPRKALRSNGLHRSMASDIVPLFYVSSGIILASRWHNYAHRYRPYVDFRRSRSPRGFCIFSTACRARFAR